MHKMDLDGFSMVGRLASGLGCVPGERRWNIVDSYVGFNDRMVLVENESKSGLVINSSAPATSANEVYSLCNTERHSKSSWECIHEKYSSSEESHERYIDLYLTRNDRAVEQLSVLSPTDQNDDEIEIVVRRISVLELLKRFTSIILDCYKTRTSSITIKLITEEESALREFDEVGLAVVNSLGWDRVGVKGEWCFVLDGDDTVPVEERTLVVYCWIVYVAAKNYVAFGSQIAEFQGGVREAQLAARAVDEFPLFRICEYVGGKELRRFAELRVAEELGVDEVNVSVDEEESDTLITDAVGLFRKFGCSKPQEENPIVLLAILQCYLCERILIFRQNREKVDDLLNSASGIPQLGKNPYCQYLASVECLFMIQFADEMKAYESRQPCGLMNSRNRCYANAILQLYFSLDDFRQQIFSIYPCWDQKTYFDGFSIMLLKLRVLFCRMLLSNSRSIDPSFLIDDITKDSFGEDTQEDAQEFDMRFKDIVEKGLDCLRMDGTDTIRSLFNGVRILVRETEVHNQTSREEAMTYEPISFLPVDGFFKLDTALECVLGPETRIDTSVGTALMYSYFSQPPTYLVFHLGKVVLSDNEVVKSTGRFTFPRVLRFGKYCSPETAETRKEIVRYRGDEKFKEIALKNVEEWICVRKSGEILSYMAVYLLQYSESYVGTHGGNEAFENVVEILLSWSRKEVQSAADFIDPSDIEEKIMGKYGLRNGGNIQMSALCEEIVKLMDQLYEYQTEEDRGYFDVVVGVLMGEVERVAPKKAELEQATRRRLMVENKLPILPAYELVSVMEHQGQSATSGHYVSHVRHKGHWLRCDDSRVQRETEYELYKRTSGVFNSVGCASSLVYRRIMGEKKIEKSKFLPADNIERSQSERIWQNMSRTSIQSFEPPQKRKKII